MVCHAFVISQWKVQKIWGIEWEFVLKVKEQKIKVLV